MNLIPARDFRARLRGWLGRATPEAGEALWLYPCRAVHTLGMRFPIDVLFLDAQGRVLRVIHRLPPWRVSLHWAARSVVELPPGEARLRLLHVGSRLDLIAHGGPDGEGRSHRRHLRAVPGLALLGAALVTGPTTEAAAPIDSEWAPEIVFETEWTPDLRRLVEDPPTSMLPAWIGPVGSAGVSASVAPMASGASAAAGTLAAVMPDRPARPSAELPPLTLVRPLAPQTLARLLDEAESLYLARQGARALEAFRQITELEPAHRGAWLRIGNLHHQRNQLEAAAQAYRRAAALAADGIPEPEGDANASVRARALANLASVALEQAREALAELQQVRVPASSATASLREQLLADLRQVETAARASGPSGARGLVEVLRGAGGGSGHAR